MLPDDMKHLINQDEKILWALRGNEVVLVTNERLIIRKSTGLGLKKILVDYPYSNMVNIKLDGGIRRSSIEILMRSGIPSIRIGSLLKTDAYRLHRIVRENIGRVSETSTNQPFPIFIQNPNNVSGGKHGDENEVCRNCGRKVSSDFSICPFCSSPLKAECPECGKRVESKYKVCPYCGQDLSYAQEIDLEL